MENTYQNAIEAAKDLLQQWQAAPKSIEIELRDKTALKALCYDTLAENGFSDELDNGKCLEDAIDVAFDDVFIDCINGYCDDNEAAREAYYSRDNKFGVWNW